MSKTKKIIFFLFALLLLVIIAAASYLLGKQSQEPAEEATENIEFEVPKSEPTIKATQTPPIATVSGKTNSSPISPTPTVLLRTKIITSIPELDGYVASDESTNDKDEIKIGMDSKLVTRGLVSYDLNELPQGVKVEEASLKLFQVKVEGHPFVVGEKLSVDHLTFGDAIDKNDYASPALLINITSFSTSTRSEWKEADVTDAVKDDVANARVRSQFRVHFTSEITNKNNEKDFVYFESGENSLNSGNLPQLVVIYY